ncbi:DUF2946 family protein [Parabacteroides sp. PF5-9]|uniref:DUF2946 family protein n=1 Tax=Parabacteroides sp. PF5-9 TaxID=1742404 RepID=UPI0024732DC1|nr:DUF2946 family protein [Parabacteroides sp. PF5-9]MDH6359054.1 hypothetical protein [Parabacteroides sp. PF5-9]
MKLERQKRIFTAWMLLFCLLPLAVTKITHHHDHHAGHTCTEMHTHIYDHDSTNAEDSTSHDHSDDSDHCEICQFILSPFLALQTEPFQSFLTLLSIEESFCLSEGTSVSAHSYSLRAPPVV